MAVGAQVGKNVADCSIDRKREYKDNTDGIEEEQYFNWSKRCYSMGCIVIKLEETQLTSIALPVFLSNLFRTQRRILMRLFW